MNIFSMSKIILHIFFFLVVMRVDGLKVDLKALDNDGGALTVVQSREE